MVNELSGYAAMHLSPMHGQKQNQLVIMLKTSA